ncbi:MAG TPA: EthD domain-containing protein [Steroidobacteraceae bacterium]|nr:EthD domain-containing protein [Steroidobacteraceae bacterium]
MIKYVQCLRRHPDLSPADFRRHWEEYKALWTEVAQQLAAIRVSFSTTLAIDANDRIAIERGTAEPFDGLVETWTHDAHDLETRRGDPAVQELEHRLFAKQHEFLDLPQCCFFFTADDD